MVVLARILKLVSAFLAGTAGVWTARNVARRLSILNQPDPLMEPHREPAPYLGGAGVFLTYGLLLLFFTGFKSWGILFAGAIWLFLILGTIDDLRPIPWWLRLIVETVLSSVAIPLLMNWFGIVIHPLLIGVSILGVMLLTNGFNLIDVSDGLAASVAGMIAVALFWAFLFYSRMPHLSLVPLLLAGVISGFLVFNRPPATIYLGKGGSLPLGFTVGTMLIIWLFSAKTADADDAAKLISRLVIFFALASPLLFELTFWGFHRIRKGRVTDKPGHFAIRLKKKGWSTSKVLLTSLGVCAFGVASVALLWLPAFITWIYAAILVSFYVACFFKLSRTKVY